MQHPGLWPLSQLQHRRLGCPPCARVYAMMRLAPDSKSDRDRYKLNGQHCPSAHYQKNNLRTERHENHDEYANLWYIPSQHAHEQPIARACPFRTYAHDNEQAPCVETARMPCAQQHELHRIYVRFSDTLRFIVSDALRSTAPRNDCGSPDTRKVLVTLHFGSTLHNRPGKTSNGHI